MNQVDCLSRIDYLKNGYRLMQDIFDESEIRTLKLSIQENLKKNISKGDGVRVWSSTEMPDELKSLVYHPQIIAEIKSTLAVDAIEFLSCKVVFKSAEISYESPWHQDRMYWGGCEKCSTWIALDDATPENGCLRVIPGSHKSEVEHTKIESNSFKKRILDKHLENDLDVVMKAGDALLFSDLLIHGSHKNTSGKDRYSVIPTYRVAHIQDDSEVNKVLWKNPVLL